jgi:membrane protein
MALLLASVSLSAAIELFGPRGAARWSATNVVISFLVFATAFTVMFKILPDVKIAWRDVWVGALLTSLLFSVGRHAVNFYITRAAVASSHGAAGSLVALLVWIYYSAIIVLFGAEVTKVYARRLGHGIEPDSHAEWRRPPAE